MYLIRNSCKQSKRRVRIWQPEPASPHGKKAAIQIEPGAHACFCFDNPDAGSMVLFGMCMCVCVCVTQYLYNTCKSQVFKPFMKSFFLKQIYEVISIIKKQKTLFKGFTRGDPWVPSLTNQNLNRTRKYKANCFKNNKKDILKDVTRGGPWAPPLTKQNLNRTQNHEVFTA